MSDWLQDRIVVVTGASRGLGAATAEAFAVRGAKVILLARSAAQLHRVAAQITACGGEGLVFPADLRDRYAVEQAFDEILRRFKHIDVLVNLAGVKYEGSVESTDYDAAVEALRVNYLGAMLCCQAVIPSMRARGSGHIINVSSVLGKRATPQRGAYSASKAALNALTDALRMELAGSRINVTLVCPGRLTEEGEEQHGWLATSNARAAEAIVSCVQHRPRELVLTLAGRILVVLNALTPAFLDRMLRGWREREVDPIATTLAKVNGGRDE